jgi:quercetin dioxygenase-like cupin family protein
MAERLSEKERLKELETDPKLYYDYEGRFIKQKLEQERMDHLPRVVKPAMFAKGGHALGDLRVFERYTIAPLSSLTCEFLELRCGEATALQRTIQATIAYVVRGSGQCLQDGRDIPFSAGDLVIIPPYTRFRLVADPQQGFDVWIPQVRLWHIAGLLWQEQFDFLSVPEGAEAIHDGQGKLTGFRVPAGILGLEKELEMKPGANAKREEVFRARRAARQLETGSTRYDWFLSRLRNENEMEANGPRLISGQSGSWEETKQGRIHFYISRWTEVAARALDLMVLEIEPRGYSGTHRHIFEELILVLEGRGHDIHDGLSHPWEAGDLICIPPMTAHQHYNDTDQPARLVSAWPRQYGHEFLGGIEQLGNASSWRE